MKRVLQAYFSLPILGVVTTVLSACSSTTREGTILMKVNDREAHVAVDGLSIKPDETIRIFRKRRSRHRHYEEEKGAGILREALSSKYYVLELPPGNQVQEGDLVSKIE